MFLKEAAQGRAVEQSWPASAMNGSGWPISHESVHFLTIDNDSCQATKLHLPIKKCINATAAKSEPSIWLPVAKKGEKAKMTIMAVRVLKNCKQGLTSVSQNWNTETVLTLHKKEAKRCLSVDFYCGFLIHLVSLKDCLKVEPKFSGQSMLDQADKLIMKK